MYCITYIYIIVVYIYSCIHLCTMQLCISPCMALSGLLESQLYSAHVWQKYKKVLKVPIQKEPVVNKSLTGNHGFASTIQFYTYIHISDGFLAN